MYINVYLIICVYLSPIRIPSYLLANIESSKSLTLPETNELHLRKMGGWKTIRLPKLGWRNLAGAKTVSSVEVIIFPHCFAYTFLFVVFSIFTLFLIGNDAHVAPRMSERRSWFSRHGANLAMCWVAVRQKYGIKLSLWRQALPMNINRNNRTPTPPKKKTKSDRNNRTPTPPKKKTKSDRNNQTPTPPKEKKNLQKLGWMKLKNWTRHHILWIWWLRIWWWSCVPPASLRFAGTWMRCLNRLTGWHTRKWNLQQC